MLIKRKPEDFIVEEIIELDKNPGEYLYVMVTKKNLNTLDIVRFFCSKLRMPRKDIGYAGSKDKRAITTQYFSLFGKKEEDLRGLDNENVKISVVSSGSKPIHLGGLSKNHFKIKIEESLKLVDFSVNYFGEQRFSKNNSQIGKAIILKEFEKACFLIDHPVVNEHLKKVKTDFIGALKKLDKKLLSLFIHAYQSYLWNEVVKIYLKESFKDAFSFEEYVFVKERKSDISIPLVGFDTVFKNELIEKIYEELLKKENIVLRDFVVRSFPECMPISTERQVFIDVEGVKLEGSSLEFTLPKGSYATVFLKQLESFL